MADKNDWYPTKDHPQAETNRIIFDNLYQLRDSVGTGRAGTNPPGNTEGMAVTISLGLDNNSNPVFLVQGRQFRRLTFSGGLIKGIS